ncbi:hypothetical protein M513_06053 [Trichuris suis]|uniref:Uncharacterized protein n=1 Tax=Trichuris suis TaxID=68888 RepID=A0A085M7E3_9BILA|nr:hypothetical protein M513_06053 [Trichuris suis]
MKFDAIRGPREQVVPLTAAGSIRSFPYRPMFCKNPFIGMYFTVGLVILPYVFYKLDKKLGTVDSCILAVLLRMLRLGIEEGRKRLKKELRERKMHRVGGEVQFLRDYEYLKEHLLKQWEKENK